MWLSVCLTVFYHLGYDCCRKQALENLHIALSSTVILWIQVYLAAKLPWSCLHWADGNSIEVSWLGSELTWTIVTHQVWLIIKGLWVFPSCSQFYCTVWMPKKKKVKLSIDEKGTGKRTYRFLFTFYPPLSLLLFCNFPLLRHFPSIFPSHIPPISNSYRV